MAKGLSVYPTSKTGAANPIAITGTELPDDKTALDVNILEGSVTGELTPSGLKNGGKITVVTLNATTWTALPLTAMPLRNQINIQNFSGVEIKCHFDNTTVGYVGMRVPSNTERFYQITDSINVYAKSQSGTIEIEVEEIG